MSAGVGRAEGEEAPRSSKRASGAAAAAAGLARVAPALLSVGAAPAINAHAPQPAQRQRTRTVRRSVHRRSGLCSCGHSSRMPLAERATSTARASRSLRSQPPTVSSSQRSSARGMDSTALRRGAPRRAARWVAQRSGAQQPRGGQARGRRCVKGSRRLRGGLQGDGRRAQRCSNELTQSVEWPPCRTMPAPAASRRHGRRRWVAADPRAAARARRRPDPRLRIAC